MRLVLGIFERPVCDIRGTSAGTESRPHEGTMIEARLITAYRFDYLATRRTLSLFPHVVWIPSRLTLPLISQTGRSKMPRDQTHVWQTACPRYALAYAWQADHLRPSRRSSRGCLHYMTARAQRDYSLSPGYVCLSTLRCTDIVELTRRRV